MRRHYYVQMALATGGFTWQANSGPVETSASCGCLLPLVILLRLTAPELLSLFWRAGGAKGFELCAGYDVLRLNRMVFVSGQLRLQAFGANCRRILIARTMRDERLVGNIQSECAVFAVSANIECVLSREYTFNVRGDGEDRALTLDRKST